MWNSLRVLLVAHHIQGCILQGCIGSRASVKPLLPNTNVGQLRSFVIYAHYWSQ